MIPWRKRRVQIQHSSNPSRKRPGSSCRYLTSLRRLSTRMVHILVPLGPSYTASTLLWVAMLSRLRVQMEISCLHRIHGRLSHQLESCFASTMNPTSCHILARSRSKTKAKRTASRNSSSVPKPLGSVFSALPVYHSLYRCLYWSSTPLLTPFAP